MRSLTAATLDGNTIELEASAIDGLRAILQGTVALPGESSYRQSCTIWNAMIERKPAIAVRCLGTADVIASVKFARQHGLSLSIRGGGHNIAGLALADRGMLLDMSMMRSVFVDRGGRSVHVDAGCLLSDIDRETQLHGLAAVLGFVSKTGAAGLTLGGGFGYLTRRFGWTSDNIRSMTLVSADGNLVHASEQENADLFWGLRGGGGNFGVVTSFEHELHEVGPEIVGGAIAWRADEASRVLEIYARMMRDAPREANCMVIARKAPPAPWIDPSAHGRSVLVLLACHTGSIADGEAWVAELKSVGSPVGDVVQRRTYVSQQCLVDATQPFGRRYYWKSDYLPGIELGLLETALEHSLKIQSPHSAIAILPLDGRLNELTESHSAVGNRQTGGVINITAAWESPSDDDGSIAWAREGLDAVRSYTTGGNYVNFLADDEPEERLRAAYGGNYQRLVEIKRKWDPDNFFRCNKNIAP